MKFIDETYKKMLDEDSMHIARDFLVTEREFLKCTLNRLENYKEAVVVGCGDYNHYELIKSTRLNYLGIDPFATTRRGSRLIKTTFEDYISNRKEEENQIFIFWFNVISHLNLAIIEKSEGIRKGDVIINSTWRTKNATKAIIEKYYQNFLPSNQKGSFNAGTILSRNRSIKGILQADSSFSTYSRGNNLFEVAII
ncbi:hypothetical protein ABK905_25945 [Acerihabitans sp. KWT182]|uniref:Uncharacterized protein n=1 Tax=Acerihabitans sp. KWT182 TaxID=3157919 RepID=A0AAU7Q9Z3_9GAMM